MPLRRRCGANQAAISIGVLPAACRMDILSNSMAVRCGAISATVLESGTLQLAMWSLDGVWRKHIC